MRLEDVIVLLLALPAEDRATVLTQVQASLARRDAAQPPASARATPTRLLDLAGTGCGLWGDDSNLYLRRLREEWR